MPPKPAKDALSAEGARSELFERATTVPIVGIPLKGEREFARGLRGIRHCLCVQDSPDNPCPCTGPLLWISKEDIVSEGPAGRRDRDARELTRLAVRRDARLVVERPRAVRADRYLRAATMSARRAVNPPRVMMKENGGGGFGLRDAFDFGYWLGTELDEATGGAISDAVAEGIEAGVSAATEPWEGFLNQ
jgi:hypothetical protein